MNLELREAKLAAKLAKIPANFPIIMLIVALATPAWANGTVLTWQDNSTNETRFHVERKVCDDTAPYRLIGVVDANVTTFTDWDVAEGVAYCYRVNALNPSKKSKYSNVWKRFIPWTRPTAPTNLTGSGIY